MDDDVLFFPLVLLVAYDRRKLWPLLWVLLSSWVIKSYLAFPRPDGTPGDIPSTHVAVSAFLVADAPLLLVYAFISRLVFHHHTVVGVLTGLMYGLVHYGMWEWWRRHIIDSRSH